MAGVFAVHQGTVFKRRVRVLADGIADLLPRDARVLDIGCGDGSIAAAVMQRRSDVEITGIDVLVRPVTLVAVTEFDGETVPFADDSFDVVTMIDVLHHTDDPVVLLKESARVARRGVVLKDHRAENPVDRGLLRFMDWVGNKGAGVVLPYNYLSADQWDRAHDACGLRIGAEVEDIPLYPRPAAWVFGGRLHLLRYLEHMSPEP